MNGARADRTIRDQLNKSRRTTRTWYIRTRAYRTLSTATRTQNAHLLCWFVTDPKPAQTNQHRSGTIHTKSQVLKKKIHSHESKTNAACVCVCNLSNNSVTITHSKVHVRVRILHRWPTGRRTHRHTAVGNYEMPCMCSVESTTTYRTN